MQNTAVEVDDIHSDLLSRVQQGLHTTLGMMKEIINEGIHTGEFRDNLDADALATFTLSLLEGGILLSKLEGSNRHIKINIANLYNYIEKCCLR